MVPNFTRLYYRLAYLNHVNVALVEIEIVSSGKNTFIEFGYGDVYLLTLWYLGNVFSSR